MSSPKTPKKSSEQVALERAQLRETNARLAEERAAIAEKKKKITSRSYGRQSLLTGSQLGQPVTPT